MTFPLHRRFITVAAVAALAAVALSGHLRAQTAVVDAAILAAMDKWHSPGAAVAVVRDGRVVMAKGYGFADRFRREPATPSTRFYIGSMTKQFTAAAVMLLVAEGRVVLDHPARSYLPRLPAAYAGVTTRQLLIHTSGVPRDLKAHNGDSLAGAALYAALAETPPDFRPGERCQYSNTEYVLLGMMVEVMSGTPFGDFLQARIFTPLEMTSTGYFTRARPAGPTAVGYEWMHGEFRAVDVVPARLGAGGVISTALDLVKWAAALDGDRLLPRPALDLMWTPGRLTDGTEAIVGSDDAGRLLGSGMGWFASDHFGHRVIHHGGNIDGYSAQIDRFIEDGITIIVLTDNEAHAAINVARPLIEAFVPTLDYAAAGSQGQLGRLAYDAGDFAEAAKCYAAALERGEKSPAIAFNAARSLALSRRPDEAFSFLDRAAAMGYRDVARLASERSLDSLRSDARWAAIAAKIAANAGRK